MRHEVGQLQAERDAMQRGLLLAEQLCLMHADSVCAAEVLGLLRSAPSGLASEDVQGDLARSEEVALNAQAALASSPAPTAVSPFALEWSPL